MRKQLLVLFLLANLMCQGCATIISGKHQKIPVTSSPSGVTVRSTDGAVITTPGNIILIRKEKHTLVAQYPGYPAQHIKINQRLNNWIWGGILIDFGIFSIPIDFATGAANELIPGEVHFDFDNANPVK